MFLTLTLQRPSWWEVCFDVGESFLWEKTVSGFLAPFIFPPLFAVLLQSQEEAKMTSITGGWWPWMHRVSMVLCQPLCQELVLAFLLCIKPEEDHNELPLFLI